MPYISTGEADYNALSAKQRVAMTHEFLADVEVLRQACRPRAAGRPLKRAAPRWEDVVPLKRRWRRRMLDTEC